MTGTGKQHSASAQAPAVAKLAALSIEVVADADAAAQQAAALVARFARDAMLRRKRFILALSGGQTPQLMFEKLVKEDMPWGGTYLVQVDERIAPLGDPARNFTSLQKILLAQVLLPRQQIYRMPVEADDPEAAARRYAKILEELAGSPPVFDLVHLGLGADGHTASLVPGDPALEVLDEDVAVTSVYQGRRRMTLTYPIINRAQRILWVVTGEAKAKMLRRLVDGDEAIPAGRIERKRAMVLADRAAATQLDGVPK
jgi:6-phosphogluconolactonase